MQCLSCKTDANKFKLLALSNRVDLTNTNYRFFLLTLERFRGGSTKLLKLKSPLLLCKQSNETIRSCSSHYRSSCVL